jgi:hypothetical protein
MVALAWCRRYLKVIALGGVAVAFFVPVTASTMDRSQHYRATGAGTTSCGDWTNDRSSDDDEFWRIKEAWVQGYVTSYNRWVSSTTDVSGWSDEYAIIGWLDNYCKAHALNDLGEASEELVFELRNKRR